MASFQGIAFIMNMLLCALDGMVTCHQLIPIVLELPQESLQLLLHLLQLLHGLGGLFPKNGSILFIIAALFRVNNIDGTSWSNKVLTCSVNLPESTKLEESGGVCCFGLAGNASSC